jgi:membrane protein
MADDTPDSKRSASDYAPPSNSDSGSADRDRKDPEDGDAGGRSHTRGGSAKPGEEASSEERPPKESPETKRADRKSPFGIVKETFSAFSGDDCSTMAAAVAYYTVFSLPPLLIVVIFVAGLFLDSAKVQQVIQQQVGGLVGPEGAEQIGTMIQNAGNLGQKGLVGLVAGIAGLLFGATGAFAQLQTALNRAWNIEPAPEGGGIVLIIFKRILSLGMVLGIAFLLLVSLVLSAALSALSGVLAQFMPGGVSAVALYVLDVAVSLAVIALLFAAVFKVLPDAKIAWRDVWMGGFVTALLFVAGKFAIGFYLGRSNPGQAFGAAGSLALILLWVYYSAMIVFLGAEFTQSWAKNKGKRIEPGSDAVRMSDQPAGT